MAAIKEEPMDDVLLNEPIEEEDLMGSDLDMDDVVAIESGKASQNTKSEPVSSQIKPPVEDQEALKKAGLGGIKKEDLFPEDEEDEYLSQPAAAPAAPLTSNFASAEATDPFVMRLFYERLFPFKTLYNWLNHSPIPSNDMKHREIAMTLVGSSGDEFYRRYLSYNSWEHLKKETVLQIPTRFEIGPIYTTNPRDRKSLPNISVFKPIAKELCFDIDLTDYDDIRTCCDKANICQKCWAFMTMSVKVLDTALREDFGFKHIMWVYSGRRGIHCWVCDKQARTMNDFQRKAIAGYLDLVRGGSQSGKKVNVRRPLHPHITRSLDILKSHFQHDVLEAQDPLQDDQKQQYMLGLFPDKTFQENLGAKWESMGAGSMEKWSAIDAVAKRGSGKSFDAKALREAKQDIVLEYTYPRLDIEVSKKLNHLLKSPFVVHPKTGRICVPVDVTRLEEFRPLEVPTVQHLLQQLDDWKGEEGRGIADWEKTDLKPYIEWFRTFVSALTREETRTVKRERDDDVMDF